MSDLLAIDIGNTNIVVGLYRGENLLATWRIRTVATRTGDEYVVLFSQLFERDGFVLSDVRSAVLSSVVPPAGDGFFAMFSKLQIEPLVVGPGCKTGMPILYENPREVGADRIVNAVAAYDKFQSGCVVVDFGTATTWDVVTPKGEYLGGIIAPGVHTAAEALYRNASKLPRVDVVQVDQVIGRNTIASMQSGLYFGYVGMVDSMVERISAEVDFPIRCLATGGLAPLIARQARSIEEADPQLTLRGLRIIFHRNKETKGEK